MQMSSGQRAPCSLKGWYNGDFCSLETSVGLMEITYNKCICFGHAFEKTRCEGPIAWIGFIFLEKLCNVVTSGH